MGVALVIAEKPSLARAIASAVGATERVGRSLRGGGYAVCWAHGHIVDLKAPDEYEGSGWDGPWDASALPMVPRRFELRVSGEEGAAGLFREIAALAASPEVDRIVHAGDPDREGEGIVRRILALAGAAKPVHRLWCSSAEPRAIREALGRMEPDAAYDGLAAAAEGRARADWLIGMNATRALTCAYGRTVQAGRVMTATLRLVAGRTREHEGFEAAPFWLVRVACGGMELETGRFGSEAEARGAMAAMSGGRVSVLSVERVARRVGPPALYSLNDMQRDASRLLGITPERSMAAAQSLYEAGMQTYPRTESRAIPSSDLPGVSALLSAGELQRVAGVRPGGWDASALVDDLAVTGHPALLPTRSLTASAHAALPDDQRLVSLLVATRLLCAACGLDHVREESSVRAECNGVGLAAAATRTVEAGWLGIRDAALGLAAAAGGQAIPDGVSAGSGLGIDSMGLHGGMTSPPALYTDDALLSAMENAGRLVGDAGMRAALGPTATKSGGLGTPATRTPAIRKLIDLGYIERSAGGVRATGTGLWVDSLSPDALAAAETTALLEMRLDALEAGEATLDGLTAEAESLARALVSEIAASFDPSKVRRPGPEPIGTCPRCGEPVVVSRSGRTARCSSAKFERGPGGGVRCVDEGCGFRVVLDVCGRRLTAAEAGTLLERGRVHVRGLTSKTGSKFDATVALDAASRYGTRLEFPKGGRPPARGGRGRR